MNSNSGCDRMGKTRASPGKTKAQCTGERCSPSLTYAEQLWSEEGELAFYKGVVLVGPAQFPSNDHILTYIDSTNWTQWVL